MVKLDLEINEIVGLAELGKIDEKKLRQFLQAAKREEMEEYIIKSTFGNDEDTEEGEDGNNENNDFDEEEEKEEDID